MILKRCSLCKVEKQIIEFSLKNISKNIYQCSCKKCLRQKEIEYRKIEGEPSNDR